jgi:hypothetical protein
LGDKIKDDEIVRDVTDMEEKRSEQRVLLRNLKVKDRLKQVCLDWSMILT